jgi:hypothetical protein
MSKGYVELMHSWQTEQEISKQLELGEFTGE